MNLNRGTSFAILCLSFFAVLSIGSPNRSFSEGDAGGKSAGGGATAGTDPAELKKSKDPFASRFKQNAIDPNLRNCFHNSSIDSSVVCTADSTPKIFRQKFPVCKTGGEAHCVAEDFLEGCYNLDFSKMTNIPGSGKCESSNAPFRLNITYTTQCLNNAATCKRESQVIVQVKLTNDGLPNLAYDFSELNKVKIFINSTQTGDPLRVACASMSEEGFRWDNKLNKCVRPLEILCEMMGLTWVAGTKECVAQNADCIDAYPALANSFCSGSTNYCSGYRYPINLPLDPSVSCLCMGTSTTRDMNDRTCRIAGEYSLLYIEDTHAPTGHKSQSGYDTRNSGAGQTKLNH